MVICFSYRCNCLFDVGTLHVIMKKLIFFFAIMIVSSVSLVAQCPMCKAALTSSRDHGNKHEQNVGNGINKGILFLLSAPYFLIGTAGFVYYKAQKKKKLANG